MNIDIVSNKLLDDMENVLSALKPSFPEAVISGGAPRDYYLMRPAKDIDVVIRDRGPGTKDMVYEALSAFGNVSEGDLSIPRGYAGSSMRDVLETFDVLVDGIDYPVNVIVMELAFTPHEAIARNDFGICQIGYDIPGFFTTDAFTKDYADNTFTLMHGHDSETQRDRSLRRYQRLAAKYPGWTAVNL